MLRLLWILAQEGGGGGGGGIPDPFKNPFAWGAFGVLLFLLAGPWKPFTLSYVADRERERADRLETELKRVNDAVLDRHVRVLGEATEAVRAGTDLAREVQSELRSWSRRP